MGVSEIKELKIVEIVEAGYTNREINHNVR
jgi:hypothetical protein